MQHWTISPALDRCISCSLERLLLAEITSLLNLRRYQNIYVVNVNIPQICEGIYKWKTAMVSHQNMELSFRLTSSYKPQQLPSGSPVLGKMNSWPLHKQILAASHSYVRNFVWNVQVICSSRTILETLRTQGRMWYPLYWQVLSINQKE